MSLTLQNNNMTLKFSAKVEPTIEEDASTNRLPKIIQLAQASSQENRVHNNIIHSTTISNTTKRPRPRRPRATQRERQRMQLLNQAFENLRRVVPRTHLADYQRLSKIATLRLAIQYIKTMNQILSEANNNNNNNNNNTIDNATSHSVFLTTTGQVVKNSLLVAASQTNTDMLNGLAMSADNSHVTQSSYEQRFDTPDMIVYSETAKRLHYCTTATTTSPPAALDIGADMQSNPGSLFYSVNSCGQYPTLSHYNQARMTDW